MTDILDINYRLYAILKGPKGYSGRSSTSSQIPGCQCKTKFEQRITTEQSVHMTCKAKCLNKWCSFNCFFTQGHSKHIWLSSLTSTPVCLLTMQFAFHLCCRGAICVGYILWVRECTSGYVCVWVKCADSTGCLTMSQDPDCAILGKDRLPANLCSTFQISKMTASLTVTISWTLYSFYVPFFS